MSKIPRDDEVAPARAGAGLPLDIASGPEASAEGNVMEEELAEAGVTEEEDAAKDVDRGTDAPPWVARKLSSLR